jgi:four helix bundle protein
MAFMFERLVVYQRAVDLADELMRSTAETPRGMGFLSDQIQRAVTSIAANLAEGNGRFTKADRRHFFHIARGSTHECVPLIELAARRGMFGRREADEFCAELEEIARMIAGLIKGLDPPPNP